MSPDELLVALVENFFKQYGIRFNKKHDKHLLLVRYFNFRLKYIPSIPRQVKISRELEHELPTHLSKNAFFDILYKTGEGKNINPYQS
jgi:hypothetical protein